MLIHWKLPSFLKISREIRNEGRCEHPISVHKVFLENFEIS
ncbi:hypothetical protein T11_5573 [Trichinella zimbabwensis]|uniref:Uncharacterized protein n=1 Tax=Trichinella zimbabwensis TaxID=268475 RepID=A0A0V1DK23_9BILA|nr:hypothetical protein T11_5573 [Trichinella zimbabwensis]